MPFLSTLLLIVLFASHSSAVLMPVNNQATLINRRGSYVFSGQNSCLNEKGMVIDTSMDSDLYHAPVKYSIYLPPCYDQNAVIRYPVIYLLHGQTFDNKQWVRLGLAEIADELINDGHMAPVIIVLPNDPDWRQPDASPFGRMLLEEMIPYIDETYPTFSDRRYRAIGGLSRGAAWALHLGLTEWQLFFRIGLHSLPVFAMDNSSIGKWLDTIPSGSAPLVYIDMGNQDPELNTARYFESQLSDRHLPHEWHMFAGTHEESYWSRHIEKYLLWYACEWTVLYYN